MIKLQKKMKLMLKILPLIGLLIFSACKGDSTQSSKNAPSEMMVDYVIANEVPMNHVIQIPGTVLPFENVEIYSEISGRIVSINFREGQRVKKGEILVRIDTEILEAQRKQLKVDLDLAQKDEKRKKSLLDSKAISMEEYEQVQSRFNSIQAQIDYVSVQISKGTIRAPFSGRLGLRQISEGAFITPSDKIVSIAQDDKVKIEFSVAERYAHRVQPGTTIDLRTSSDSTLHTAKVYATEPIVDANTRMLTARAEMNGSSTVFPGSYVEITYNLGKDENSILIPTTALVPVLNGQKIWLIKDGKAKSIMVEPGIRTKDEVQVWGDVKQGDTIVITGLLGIREGMDVKGKVK